MDDPGAVLYGHVEALFPHFRSITGPGLRRTLRYVADHIPLKIREVPSGTRVLDWRGCSTGRCRRSGRCAAPACAA